MSRLTKILSFKNLYSSYKISIDLTLNFFLKGPESSIILPDIEMLLTRLLIILLRIELLSKQAI